MLANSQIVEKVDEFTGNVEYKYEQPKLIPFENLEAKAKFWAKFSKEYSREEFVLEFFMPLGIDILRYPIDVYFLIDGERVSIRMHTKVNPFSDMHVFNSLSNQALERDRDKFKNEYPFLEPGETIHSFSIPKEYFQKIAEAEIVRARIKNYILVITPHAREGMREIYLKAKELK